MNSTNNLSNGNARPKSQATSLPALRSVVDYPANTTQGQSALFRKPGHHQPGGTQIALRPPSSSDGSLVTRPPTHAIDQAFSMFGERINSDLQEFRSICAGLVVKEKMEAEKWHSLCMKIMRERDAARQKLSEVEQRERERSAGISKPPSALNLAPVKRAYDGDVHMRSNTHSRSNSLEMRPVRGLRLSPIHSPPGSPDSYSSSPPPLSSSSSTTPPTSAGSTFSVDEMLPRFESSRPGKRRKSCEVRVSSGCILAVPEDPKVKQQPRTPSPLTFSPVLQPGAANSAHRSRATPATLPPDFPHIDIMYMSKKGSLVCRACLLEKSKFPHSPLEPKCFPLGASFDDLREHCFKKHPDACADVARLHPAEIFELRRRLSL